MNFKVQGDGLLIAEGRWVSKDNPAWLEAVANGATVEGETVTEPDYVALRTGPDGYAPIAEQMDMQYKADGSWEAHIADVKARYPKTITGGETIAEVPAWVTEKAAEWLFNDQLTKYRAAVKRLSQYRLADGRPEIIESQPTGEQIWDEELQDMVDVMHDVVVQTAIEPLPVEVEETVYDEDGNATTMMVENPLVTKDKYERSKAQAVVDATPQAVIDAA